MRQTLRGFGSATDETRDILATSSVNAINPIDVAMCEVVVPRESKRQWIRGLSDDA